jgi:hypothetical protein
MSYADYKSLRCRLLWGVLIAAVLGTLAHFFYGWSGENKLVGFFAPVNESTWEHMKLAFFPMLLLAIIFPKISNVKTDFENPVVSFALLTGCMAATWLIPVLYYFYSGVLGFTKTWIDIAVFYLSIGISALAMLHIIKRLGVEGASNVPRIGKAVYICAVVRIVLYVLIFWFFTYMPPKLGIFNI